MEPVLQWGLDFIRVVQTIASPPLTVIVRAITHIGGETAYMVLLPFLYWCIDEKKGLRLGLAVLISAWINMSLKFLLDQPRPFFEGYDPSLGMISERLGGLPSGHAQNTLVMLFIIASWIKKKWAFVCAAVLCILIGFSRIYLGVHFPTDIIAGWILGGIVLCGYFMLGDRIEILLVKGGFRAGMIASAAVSFLMILYLPGKELLLPGGILLGIGAGYCLNRRYVGFSANALLRRTGIKKYFTMAVRFVFGITIFALFIFAIGKVIPQIANSNNEKLSGFACYVIIGLLISVGVPWVFVKLRLAGSELS
ncbi:MAG: phosphatase PAP2 family protein [Treponema sp.]|jgi:membrane-associated phospholipid phosphatase|nr:phosphatase PAP2 family protein [Treponema sp.]